MYEVFLTHEAQRFYEQADPVLVRKLNRCFQYLRENLHEHPNSKRHNGPRGRNSREMANRERAIGTGEEGQGLRGRGE